MRLVSPIALHLGNRIGVALEATPLAGTPVQEKRRYRMNGIQTTIVGNLTADPELKYGNGGGAMLTFSIASERSWRNKDGEWENEVSFPDCIAWRNTAEDAANVLSKGMRIMATGRFEQRFWEDKESGQRRNKWQFVIDEIAVSTRIIESLERKRRDNENQGGGKRSAAPARAAASSDEAW